VDGYGNSTTSGFYAGISATLVGPRATVIEGNIISANEVNNATTYQYLAVTGNGVTDTKAIVNGNSVLGGYVNTSSTTSLVLGAQTACTPVSMNGIVAGVNLWVENESVIVASVTSTTFTPTTNWTHNHGPSSYSVSSNKSQGLSNGLLYTSSSTQQSGGKPCTIVSCGNRVEGVGHYSYLDTYTTVGPAGVDGSIAVTEQVNYAVPTLSNGSTIPTLGLGSSVVTATANVTGIILQAGTQAGQYLVVVNEASFTITFAASGTSHVADGATLAIPGNCARVFVWCSLTSLWYRSA
jgi:hypothetical protein